MTLEQTMTRQAMTRTGAQTIQQVNIWWTLRNRTRRGFIWGTLCNNAARLFTRITGVPCLIGELRAILIQADGTLIDYGVLGRRVVTTAFVNDLVDELQAAAEFADFDFHDSGVGVTAENVADTDIETTDGEARASGTPGEGASANIYQNVGTISYTTTKAITEHGLFNNLTGATLMDRTVFSAINVVNGDSIKWGALAG